MNPTAPTVKLELEGQKFLLRLDFNALARFEEASGKSALELGEKLDARAIRALLWACIADDHPDITLEDVGRMIHIGNMTEVSAALTELMKVSVPEGRGEGRPPRKRSTG